VTFLTIISTLILSPQIRLIVAKILSFEFFSWQEYNPQIVNSLNIRFILWGCTLDILNDNYNWLFGVGTGDAQQLLNACYDLKAGSQKSLLAQLNLTSHNQYLSIWLNLGIIGLLVFLFNLLSFLYDALQRKDIYLLMFILVIIFSSLTESILNVQKGVVFYAIFISHFLFNHTSTASIND
jgi:O-antigen ligase